MDDFLRPKRGTRDFSKEEEVLLTPYPLFCISYLCKYVPMPNTWTHGEGYNKNVFLFCLFIEYYLRKDNKNIYTAKVGRY